MDAASHDAQLCRAAFNHVNRLAILRGGVLDSADFTGGFEFGGERIPLSTPSAGSSSPARWPIYCPSEPCFPGEAGAFGMRIRARPIAKSMPVMMSSNTRSWAVTRTRRITAGSGMLCSGRSRSSISSARRRVTIRLTFRHSSSDGIPSDYESNLPSGRSSGLRPRPPCQRLHQASFRDAVLAAYRGRCAICHIPEPRLLDAVHIIMDADEQLGQPIVSNGLPLSKIHHAAFDAHLSWTLALLGRSSGVGHQLCQTLLQGPGIFGGSCACAPSWIIVPP